MYTSPILPRVEYTTTSSFSLIMPLLYNTEYPVLKCCVTSAASLNESLQLFIEVQLTVTAYSKARDMWIIVLNKRHVALLRNTYCVIWFLSIINNMVLVLNYVSQSNLCLPAWCGCSNNLIFEASMYRCIAKLTSVNYELCNIQGKINPKDFQQKCFCFEASFIF